MRGMQQSGANEFIKMRMVLSVWEFRTGSKSGGGLAAGPHVLEFLATFQFQL